MSQKKSIAVVVGQKEGLYILPFIEKLEELHADVLLLGGEELLNSVTSPVTIKVFNQVNEMPGYFRGLYEDLKSVDLVVIVEPHFFSSYQALSTAKKLDKPCILISNLIGPPFLNQSSQEFLMFREVMFQSDQVYCFSEMASEYMLLEGVPSCQVEVLDYSAPNRLKFRSDLRSKFRSYVGIPSHSQVIFTRVEEDDLRSRDLLLAIKLLVKNNRELASSLKVIISSDFDCSVLKYLASDLGIASYVLFINQDIEPFRKDLYSAIDAMLEYSQYNHKPSGFELVDAAACGVLPITRSGSVAGELLRDISIPLVERGFSYLGTVLEQALQRLNAKTRQCDQICQSIEQKYRQKNSNKIFSDKALRIIKGYEMRENPEDIDVNFQLSQIEVMTSCEDFDSALLSIEEFIKSDKGVGHRLSGVFRIKGDILLKRGDVEAAMDAFDQAVQHDNQNWRSYLGLAKISLITHSEEDAISFYKKVLGLNPHNAAALAGIGKVYRSLGMYEESIYWLCKSLVIEPYNDLIVLELAQASVCCEDSQRVIDKIEQLDHQVGEKPCIVMALGQLYLKVGKVEKGKEMVAKALAADDFKPKIA